MLLFLNAKNDNILPQLLTKVCRNFKKLIIMDKFNIILIKTIYKNDNKFLIC